MGMGGPAYGGEVAEKVAVERSYTMDESFRFLKYMKIDKLESTITRTQFQYKHE